MPPGVTQAQQQQYHQNHAMHPSQSAVQLVARDDTVSGSVQVNQSQMKGPKRVTDSNHKPAKKASIPNGEKRSSSVANAE